MQQDDGGRRKQRADASGLTVPNSELRVIRRPLCHMSDIFDACKFNEPSLEDVPSMDKDPANQ